MNWKSILYPGSWAQEKMNDDAKIIFPPTSRAVQRIERKSEDDSKLEHYQKSKRAQREI